MAYAALSTIQTIATGQVFTAATLQQANDNDEFLINPPACSIKETTAQPVADSTATALTSDEENFDNDSMHSTTTNTSRITIQTAGRYLLYAVVSFASDLDGQRVLDFRVNGTTAYEVFRANTGGTGVIVATAVKTLVLSAADYVEIRASHNAGNALDVTLVEFAAIFITR